MNFETETYCPEIEQKIRFLRIIKLNIKIIVFSQTKNSVVQSAEI
jgi:hypothetical protein